MKNRRNTVGAALAAMAFGLALLAGCRAFEPEVVIVNKPPETYIIGAPIEGGGGYYHFHVFWYGSDEDGTVERFVWALTDTSVQDPLTSDDEEDERFNPALNASTLEIANWTTRTDSIFDFRIEQGTKPSADFTLHMVAIDDFGDYDRTPARLYFFSNTLGTPVIDFYRVEQDGDTVRIAPGASDTVGFRKPYEVAWLGSTPNIVNYDPARLADIDTVYPFDDGLFGYKWQLRGEFGGNCVPSQTDCWHPRRFNPTTGDSFSVFAEINGLRFANNGRPFDFDTPGANNPFEAMLPSGPVTLQVNSIDVAGVEVAEFRREFSFVVNRDPFTSVLDSASHGDAQIYPYYVELDDPLQTKVPFGDGALIPDRTYVVVKALGRDDPDDEILDPGYGMGLEGFVRGRQARVDGGRFSITTESSDLNTDLGDPDPQGWYADTLGFIVAPRTSYTFNMTAVDEHGRRDGTPARIGFHVGHPPCLQCIEVLPNDFRPSDYPDPDLACYEEGGPPHPCLDGSTTELTVRQTATEDTDLQYVRNAFFAVERSTKVVTVEDSTEDLEGTHEWIDARIYKLVVLLHGQDDPRERWADPLNRIMAWRYQVDYDCDPANVIKDGGGIDDITRITGGENPDEGLTISRADGLWKLEVEIAVPADLFRFPPATFWTYVNFLIGGGEPELTDALYYGSLRQLGHGWIRAVALDQTTNAEEPRTRPSCYNYFRNVRPTAPLPAGKTWRDCDLENVGGVLSNGLARPLSLGGVAMESNAPVPDYDWRSDPNGNPWTDQNGNPVRGQPVRRDFRIVLHGQDSQSGNAPFTVDDCNTPPN